jgi:hypothetical protein
MWKLENADNMKTSQNVSSLKLNSKLDNYLSSINELELYKHQLF